MLSLPALGNDLYGGHDGGYIMQPQVLQQQPPWPGM